MGALALVAFGLGSLELFIVELAAIGGLLAIDRFGVPRIERWGRGARGEEEVGRVLERLGDRWFVLHDVVTDRGNIDHVVVGPGGLFTVETKSHRGRISVERIDPRMLKQAYAQAKWLERATGHDVEPLLVFSAAYLDRPIARRRGVLVLPARMLARHLAGRKDVLSAEEIARLGNASERAASTLVLARNRASGA